MCTIILHCNAEIVTKPLHPLSLPIPTLDMVLFLHSTLDAFGPNMYSNVPGRVRHGTPSDNFRAAAQPEPGSRLAGVLLRTQLQRSREQSCVSTIVTPLWPLQMMPQGLMTTALYTWLLALVPSPDNGLKSTVAELHDLLQRKCICVHGFVSTDSMLD